MIKPTRWASFRPLPRKTLLVTTIAVLLSILAITLLLWHLNTSPFANFFSAKPGWKAEPIKIAVANAFSGPNAASGIAMLRGAQLLADKVNAEGGIHGHPLVLQPFDDLRSAEQAEKVAEQIGSVGSDVVAVIGHGSSTASRAAGHLYRLYKVPAVTPTSTNPNVTQFNPWYFRVIFNDDLQASILAHYIKSVLNFQSAAVVHLADTYAATLNRTFGFTAEAIGLHIRHQIVLSNQPQPDEIDAAADLLATDSKTQAILLILRPPQAKPLVQALHQRGVTAQLLGTDSLALAGFAAEQGEEPVAALEPPPHFTDGMYIAAPFIPDTATAAARQFLHDYATIYREDPIWSAIYAYDSARVISEALRRLPAIDLTDVSSLREATRAQLAAMNTAAHAAVGLMGPLYFNTEGDVIRPVYIARAKGGHITPATRQLQLVDNPELVSTLRAQGENIIDLGDSLLQIVQVVYTGIHWNKLQAIDEKARTFQADFDVWFRYSGALDIENLVFPDAVTPIRLAKPTVVRDLLGEHYRAFRVQGTFLYTTTHRNLIDGNEYFTIQFHHAHLDQSRLVFVTDSQNMGLSEGYRGWSQILRAEQVLAADSGWVIKEGAVYQEIHNRSTLGDPLFPMIALPYSYFYANIQGHQGEVSLQRQLARFLPDRFSVPWFIFFGALFLSSWTPWLQHRYPVPMALVRLVTSACLLYLLENLFNALYAERLELYQLELMLLFFKSLWWLLPALFVVALLPPLVWRPIERRTRYPVPNVARTFVNLVVFGIAGVCILAFVFDRPLTTIWAASGLLTLILGIALQNLILDAFSGLVLNLEQPFTLSQWIGIATRWHGRQFGRVEELNWRTTRLWTRDNNLVVIPNSIISNAAITNYSRPTYPSRMEIPVVLEFSVPVEHAQQVLEESARQAVVSGAVLGEQPIRVVVDTLESYGVRYKIQVYHHPEMVSPEVVKTAVNRAVMTRLQAEGLKVALPLDPLLIRRGSS
ncbi:MAG TPA: ABC transporter substrate-binding protein [Candidatus Competibacteraceae bacterium]|nr:ABC transporter substrate-binding protein [Candidatus Competibacteraceae bacterium]